MQKIQKSESKKREGKNYQVAGPSELFFVDLNGRVILVGSHCFEAERMGWGEEKRIFLFFGGGRGEEDRGVEGPRGGTH